MCQNPLPDKSFYPLLLLIDRSLADEARAAGCPLCGASVHCGDYPRKPRGGPRSLRDNEALSNRFSYCCARDGCRKRVTPFSTRFLGRKVYWSVVVVLVSAARYGLTPGCARDLCAQTGASPRTLARWVTWWREAFPASRFWAASRARLSSPVDPERLPLSLLERFVGGARQQLEAFLRFVLPITSGSAPGALPV